MSADKRPVPLSTLTMPLQGNGLQFIRHVQMGDPRCCKPHPVQPDCLNGAVHYGNLLLEQAHWTAMNRRGGIQKLCRRTDGGHMMEYQFPPNMVMPPTGSRLEQTSIIDLPPAGSTQNVLVYTVPSGYKGVIVSIVQQYTGTGYSNGSGDLTWSLSIGTVFAKGLGLTQTQLGSISSRFALEGAYLEIDSQDRILYTIEHALASSLSGGRIICAIQGWIYPDA
jgi:hypothetical protein